MYRDFNQAYISPALIDFKKGFLDKWGLAEYTNLETPTVFFGMYNQEDVNAFLSHKGPRVVLFGGNDMHPQQLNILKREQQRGDTYSIQPPGEFSNTLERYNISHKVGYVAFKDYSNLHSSPLGENIYIYLGRPDNRRLEYFKYNEIVKPLIQMFGRDRVKWVTEPQTLPFTQLKEKYYEDSFCYIRPNPRGGATAMHELAHMGRRTIGKGFEGLEYFTEYSDINNLTELIIEESKFIGKTRNNISESVKGLFVGEEWLTLQYYKT
mgnify:FL=1|jgi:hypothetical protein|tara:strand:- start:132 stop:929 length:798 start_codon:yes stop_codon:yes gene_type:complete